MRPILFIAIMAILLAGCSETDGRVPESRDSVTAAPIEASGMLANGLESPGGTPGAAIQLRETAAPLPEETPYLYIQRLETDDGGDKVVQVRANADMDRNSVEQAINKSLVKSKEEQLNYNLDWISSTFLQIRFHLVSEDKIFSFAFDLDDAKTVSGGYFSNDDNPQRNQVTVQYEGIEPRLTLKKWPKGESKFVPAWRTGWIKPIRSADKNTIDSYLFYDKEEHQLYKPANGEVLKLRSPAEPPAGYDNDYGYKDMFSDRFYNGYTYMVSGNKTLYKANTTGRQALSKLRSFKRPVYGMSSSPDGKKIAVLMASDEYLGPDADLIVLNDKGQTIFSRSRAVYLSHSDGFLFMYPIEWQDNRRIILPAGTGPDNPLGKLVFDLTNKSSVPLKDERVTKQMIADLFAHEKMKEGYEDYYLIAGAQWSPDSRYAAYQTSGKRIWVYDRKDRSITFAGAGTLLGWLPDNELLWASGKELVYTY
ncbi:hypothetical protein [Paenibacillus sp. NPDC058071]|uniref:hypothetical protein n=1 Tax=Paenibacillus sp. NPDC058071 TaxID=3346326 RepID=UPI0036DA9E27